MKRNRPLILLVLFVLAQIVQEHPGHGLHANGITHVLASPYHLLILASLAAICWGASLFVRQWLYRRLLKMSAAMALAGAVLLWSL